MAAALLPDSHLASVVAMAELVDVAVAAGTPHQTLLPGPGSVEVIAATPFADAH